MFGFSGDVMHFMGTIINRLLTGTIYIHQDYDTHFCM